MAGRVRSIGGKLERVGALRRGKYPSLPITLRTMAITADIAAEAAEVAASDAADSAASALAVAPLSAAGVPDNGDGTDGQLYVNESTGDVYAKTGGVWQIV
jgi:hypothetical protein